MNNEFFFQLNITDEQVGYSNKLVDFSLIHHPVQDIYRNDPDGIERQREFRFTGTLGEVVFADTYEFNRPNRSFGAVDGQDFGQDFLFPLDGIERSLDVKTMRRIHNILKPHFVLNLPSYQVHKGISKTECYFCISIHSGNNSQLIATFLGYIFKEELLKGKMGILYKAGTKRIKDNGSSFIFQRDTYEVFFKDIYTPPITERILNLDGYQKHSLI